MLGTGGGSLSLESAEFNIEYEISSPTTSTNTRYNVQYISIFSIITLEELEEGLSWSPSD